MRVSQLSSDLRHAARRLLRAPAFTVAVVGLLGLAIGTTAAMFAVVKTVLIDPLPFAEPERLVFIAASAPGTDMSGEVDVSPELFVHYTEHSQRLEAAAVYGSGTQTLRVADRVERVRMSQPTNSLFTTLGVAPILGRLPVDADEEDAIVISHALWTEWFGRDPAVIGRRIDAADRERTIVGVMGPDFHFPDRNVMLWMSYSLKAADITELGDFDYNMVGRLAPGATPRSLAEELTVLSRQVPGRFGGSPGYARLMEHHQAIVRPLGEQMWGRYSRALWVLLGAAVVVLLIACANVANLFLVRLESRHRELALRGALGAARGRLLRFQFAEALVVALLAGGVALVLAAVTLPVFLHLAPAGIPRLDEVRVDAATLLFTAFAAAACALACGGLAALRGSRPDLARLREGGRGSTGRSHAVRHVLVAGQAALALVLLIGSGLLLRSAWELRHVDPGYDTRDILTFQIAPHRPELNDAVSYARFNLAFLDRLAALPGVRSAGIVENVPIDEATARIRVRTETTEAGSDGVPVNVTFSAGDYFRTMGIALKAGRTFGADDHGVTRGNILVSESAARLLWPGRDPLGQRLQRSAGSPWETVVGVVGDVLQDGLQSEVQPLVYFPLVGPAPDGGRARSSPGFALRTTVPAESLVPAVRALVRELAPEAPLYRVHTMQELAERSMQQVDFSLLTLGLAALLALVLGAVGLYAVLSQVVAERTREIGVRMALGARAGQVRAMVVGQGFRVVAIGMLVGLGAALAATRVLGSLLYGVGAHDLATFLVMTLVMGAVGLFASWLPAWRASRLDPVESLRRE